ncbi:phosphatase PAP2 family protein [Myxococcota bacterium]|nr:phosphatase PAP2 family protein [Myxococcota bacterium]
MKLIAAILFLGLLIPQAALAESVYDVDPYAEGAAVGGTFIMLGLLDYVVKPTLDGGISCSNPNSDGYCDPSQLNSLDRSVLDNDSETWRHLSDAGLYTAIGITLVADAVDVFGMSKDGTSSDYFTDLLVISETVAATTLLTDLIKYSVQRPRPAQYKDGVSVASYDNRLSFPSGHTSSTTALATSYAMTFALRNPDNPWRYAVFAGALGLSATTGYARIAGGKHFPTDVAAGFVMGATMGFLVPWLHRQNSSAALSLSPDPAVGGGMMMMRFAY